jgi:UDP-N-acetylglucosamine/UDP-N-acetylgalactosamine diphosphorylase
MAAKTASDKLLTDLLERLTPHGQQHLVAHWSRLSATEQANLAQQIDEIDFDLFRKLRDEHSSAATSGRDEKSKWADLAARAVPPPAMRLDGSGVPFSRDAAIAAGRQALSAGQVGMTLVAGGLGTRLGCDQPKGMFPIGPLSGRSLFQVLLEQLLAVGRRHGQSIPLYVMTSPATDAETRAFLAEHDNFGLPACDVHIFCQATMWAVDERFERILLESPSSLFLGPDGHGGMLAAFEKSGCLQDANRRGIQHLFYGQIDNPLTQVCDP